MIGDRWTFLLVRDGHSTIKQYALSSRRLQVLVGGGLLAAIILIGYALTIGVDGYARLRSAQLDTRNTVLQDELQEFQMRVDHLESTLNQIAQNDARFRSIAGLESIDSEVLQAGVGGPGLVGPEAHSLWTIDPSISENLFEVSYDLNQLERRARLLSSSLEEATDSLLAHRDLLESTPSILPTPGWLSSSYSESRMHPIHNRPLPHPGVDISAPKGTSIYAAAKGKVIKAGWIVGYGLTIEIDHGFGYVTLYGHASELVASQGEEVQRGDVIARVGSTGIATSPHLHYEVRVQGIAQNPANFILPEYVRY
ncbi:MAG: M23 family metallopeptidase [Gemmatimonadetes bacterium]|mgnify:FL=1|nr:M23 family metallopeptidase [Gemmatimonadota bacterium]GIS79219.1 MAG: peptidase [Gammaproteobacteria bacterium]GIT49885.1 MAG: peptidase [Gemmatimonadota bacterium]|tara:strand:+ start:6395 stop:7327 length:933 start_codon:yes stop_codon:yes gene_type:complete